MASQKIIKQILDFGRWAPSGDNTQPWRFQIISDSRLILRGSDTREYCVYDLDGHPSQISLGALLETISIAATSHLLRTKIVRRLDTPDTTPTFDIEFVADSEVQPDPLISQVQVRSVQRRPMRSRRLTLEEKRRLECAVGSSHRVIWLEGAKKMRTARFMFDNAKLRLTMPEAYRVHREVIQWGVRFSEDRVPDQALGVDPLTARLMRWVMTSWKRVEFFNHYLAGTLVPRIQMDLLPGLFCASHFVIISDSVPTRIDDYIAAGRAVQRFWLVLTEEKLVMQPEMTPLIFSRYARESIDFSKSAGMRKQALTLSHRLDALIGQTESLHAVFMGRIGAGPNAFARSTRRSLDDLLLPSDTPDPPKEDFHNSCLKVGAS